MIRADIVSAVLIATLVEAQGFGSTRSTPVAVMTTSSKWSVL